MNDGWRMFGAGCLGVIAGFAIAVAVTMDEHNDRLADLISERVQRAIQFHFAHWSNDIEQRMEAQHGDGH